VHEGVKCTTERTEDVDGTITYTSTGDREISPGESVVVEFSLDRFSGLPAWPGIPETRKRNGGLVEDFKPVKFTIANGCSLSQMWFGGTKVFSAADYADAPRIPAEHLASDIPQPNFQVVPEGHRVLVTIENTSKQPVIPWARFVGRKVAS
jgi:hypothetical protein